MSVFVNFKNLPLLICVIILLSFPTFLLADNPPTSYSDFKIYLDEINFKTNNLVLRKDAAALFITDEVIIDYIEKQLSYYISRYKTTPLVFTRIIAWDALYLVEAAIDLYVITSNEKYLFLITKLYDYIIPLRDSSLGYYDEFTGKIHDTWGAETWGYYMTNPTWTGRIAYPALKFSYYVKKNNLTKFYDKANIYTEVMKCALDSHDILLEELHGTAKNYRNLYSGFLEAYNHLPSIIAAYIYLGYLDNPSYHLKAVKISNSFIEDIIHKDDTCHWGYAKKEEKRVKFDSGALNPEQIWKAHETIQIIRHLTESNLLSDSKKYINCITNNFLQNIYLGFDSTSKQANFSPYINSFKNQRYNYMTMPKKYSAYLSWIYFSKSDEKVADVLVGYLINSVDKFPYLWLTNGVSLRAYAVRRTLNEH